MLEKFDLVFISESNEMRKTTAFTDRSLFSLLTDEIFWKYKIKELNKRLILDFFELHKIKVWLIRRIIVKKKEKIT